MAQTSCARPGRSSTGSAPQSVLAGAASSVLATRSDVSPSSRSNAASSSSGNRCPANGGATKSISIPGDIGLRPRAVTGEHLPILARGESSQLLLRLRIDPRRVLHPTGERGQRASREHRRHVPTGVGDIENLLRPSSERKAEVTGRRPWQIDEQQIAIPPIVVYAEFIERL